MHMYGFFYIYYHLISLLKRCNSFIFEFVQFYTLFIIYFSVKTSLLLFFFFIKKMFKGILERMTTIKHTFHNLFFLRNPWSNIASKLIENPFRSTTTETVYLYEKGKCHSAKIHILFKNKLLFCFT